MVGVLAVADCALFHPTPVGSLLARHLLTPLACTSPVSCCRRGAWAGARCRRHHDRCGPSPRPRRRRQPRCALALAPLRLLHLAQQQLLVVSNTDTAQQPQDQIHMLRLPWAHNLTSVKPLKWVPAPCLPVAAAVAAAVDSAHPIHTRTCMQRWRAAVQGHEDTPSKWLGIASLHLPPIRKKQLMPAAAAATAIRPRNGQSCLAPTRQRQDGGAGALALRGASCPSNATLA